MTVSLIPNLIFRAFDANGIPLAGGKLYTKLAGSNTNQATWTDSTGLVQNTNPIILDSTGSAHVWLGDNAYKFLLNDANDVPQPNYPIDNITRFATYGEFAAFIVQLSSTTYISQGAGLIGYKFSSIAAARTLLSRLQDRYSVIDLSVPTDGTTDATTALNKFAQVGSYVEIAEGTYRISKFPEYGNKTYVARGNVVFNLFNNADAALVKFKTGSSYEGFEFRSTELDLNSQRVAIDDVKNIYAKLCSAYDFLNPTSSNGWGVLIQRSSNIVLDNWKFGNNTQSDIALTDTCRDITIINPRNDVDSGVYLNVEPNGSDGVIGMNVIGGLYRQVDLLENNNGVYASKALFFSGCRITLLRFDGASATFARCTIGTITPESTTTVYAGSLSMDCCDLGKNLIDDSYLFSASISDANSYWLIYNDGATPGLTRFNGIDYKYALLNPSKELQQVIITTRNYIAVTANEVLLLAIRNKVNNVGNGTYDGHVIIQWYNSGFALISETAVQTARAGNGAISDWCDDVAFPKAPATAAFMKIRLTNNYTTQWRQSFYVNAIGLYRFSLLQSGNGGGNMDKVLSDIFKNNNRNDYYQAYVPAGANGYPGYFVGERILPITPVIGNPKASICTVASSTGTWVSEGNL